MRPRGQRLWIAGTSPSRRGTPRHWKTATRRPATWRRNLRRASPAGRSRTANQPRARAGFPMKKCRRPRETDTSAKEFGNHERTKGRKHERRHYAGKGLRWRDGRSSGISHLRDFVIALWRDGPVLLPESPKTRSFVESETCSATAETPCGSPFFLPLLTSCFLCSNLRGSCPCRRNMSLVARSRLVKEPRGPCSQRGTRS